MICASFKNMETALSIFTPCHREHCVLPGTHLFTGTPRWHCFLLSIRAKASKSGVRPKQAYQAKIVLYDSVDLEWGGKEVTYQTFFWKEYCSPTSMAQLVEGHPAKQKVVSSILDQGTCLGCGPSSQNLCKRQTIDVSLAHWCFSPSLSPCALSKKINKIFKKKGVLPMVEGNILRSYLGRC